MKTHHAILISTLLLALSACGGGGGGSSTGPGGCGDLNLRIVGGAECRYEESPVVAVVPVKMQGDKITGIWLCSGTMVTLDDVLTSAHCLVEPALAGANGVAVLVRNEVHIAVNLAVNPLYDGSTASPFDVAMLTLEAPVGLPPVPILASDPVEVGESITIFGYGNNESGQTALELGLKALKAGRMIVEKAGPMGFAAFFDDAGSAICQGDSGGPATQKQGGVTSIVGINSFTVRGCQSGSASGFASMQIKGNVDFVKSYAPDITIR